MFLNINCKLKQKKKPDVSLVKSGLGVTVKAQSCIFSVCTGCCLLYSYTCGLYTVDISKGTESRQLMFSSAVKLHKEMFVTLIGETETLILH